MKTKYNLSYFLPKEKKNGTFQTLGGKLQAGTKKGMMAKTMVFNNRFDDFLMYMYRFVIIFLFVG